MTSRTWTLLELVIGDETFNQTYTFTIGHLDYVGEPGDIFLHIPEMPARGAEGRPKYQEQAQWIRGLLAKHSIRAKEIWWSHWQFKNAEEAKRFEGVLHEAGANQ